MIVTDYKTRICLAWHRLFQLVLRLSRRLTSSLDTVRPAAVRASDLSSTATLESMIKKTIIIIAVIGLMVSAILHLSTFFGVNPMQELPCIWIFHIMVFVVWSPMVSLLSKNKRNDSWKIATRNVPRWIKIMALFLFIYALFNFFFTSFILNDSGVPSELNGKKVLHSHGNIIKELTDEEYEKHSAYGIRGFSGHWMLFYFAGMIGMYIIIKEDSNKTDFPDSENASPEI